MGRNLNEHRMELVGGLVLLLISLILPYVGVPRGIAWFVAITSVLLALSVAAIKVHITTVVFRQHESYGKLAELSGMFSELDGRQLDAANKELERAVASVRNIERGIISLDTPRYFDMIIERMRSIRPRSVVYAVNCIDLLRWRDDPQEALYLQENKKAAERAVRIHRIFILDKALFSKTDHDEMLAIIKEQLKSENIEVSVAWRELLSGQSNRIRDWVLFTSQPRELYVDYPDPVDTTRVAFAELVIDGEAMARALDDFRILKEYAISEEELLKELRARNRAS